MRAIIVDDDSVSCTYLSQVCSSIPGLEIVAIYNNALDAIQFLNEKAVDVVFLDIEMPGFSGLELVKTLPSIPYVVFITSTREYAVEAFELNACDYLQKPVTLPRLQKALLKVKNEATTVAAGMDDVFIKVDGRLVKVNLNEVLYIETVGDYVLFRMQQNKQYIVHSTLSGMEKKISHPHFIKVHRSYIVNLSKIVDIEEHSLVIADKVIPISRAARPLLMSRIKTL